MLARTRRIREIPHVTRCESARGNCAHSIPADTAYTYIYTYMYGHDRGLLGALGVQ